MTSREIQRTQLIPQNQNKIGQRVEMRGGGGQS